MGFYARGESNREIREGVQSYGQAKRREKSITIIVTPQIYLSYPHIFRRGK